MDLPQGIATLVQQFGLIPNVQSVLLFGSRARGDAADRSDFDLAIDAPDLTKENWDKIYWMVEDAETLYKIDCVWLQKANEEFKNNILRDAKVLFKR